MVLFITLITLTHGTFFAYDEYILNKKRQLTQKEINSALLDGVLFLGIVALTIFTTYTAFLGRIFISLSFLSCVSIIKNEIFYPVLDLRERLVHSILYVLHPLILYAFYLSWEMDFFNNNMNYWMLQLCYLALGFKAMCYHVIYWNFIHNK